MSEDTQDQPQDSLGDAFTLGELDKLNLNQRRDELQDGSRRAAKVAISLEMAEDGDNASAWLKRARSAIAGLSDYLSPESLIPLVKVHWRRMATDSRRKNYDAKYLTRRRDFAETVLRLSNQQRKPPQQGDAIKMSGWTREQLRQAFGDERGKGAPPKPSDLLAALAGAAAKPFPHISDFTDECLEDVYARLHGERSASKCQSCGRRTKSPPFCSTACRLSASR